MHFLPLHNIRIFGQGTQPIVFVHGFGCNQHMWRLVAPAFEADYRVVLFDLAGSCDTNAAAYDPERYATLHAHAHDLLGVLREANLHDVVLVAHSVSCMIAVLAAIAEPQRFARLVLVAPSPRYLNAPGYYGGFERADIEEMLSAMDHNYLGWSQALAAKVILDAAHPELVQEMNTNFCRTDPAVARHFARVTFLGDNRADLPYVRTPTLVLQCAHDLIAPLAVGQYVHDHIPGSRLVVLEASGHCPQLSAPRQTVAAIVAFLSHA